MHARASRPEATSLGLLNLRLWAGSHVSTASMTSKGLKDFRLYCRHILQLEYIDRHFKDYSGPEARDSEKCLRVLPKGTTYRLCLFAWSDGMFLHSPTLLSEGWETPPQPSCLVFCEGQNRGEKLPITLPSCQPPGTRWGDMKWACAPLHTRTWASLPACLPE